jgi:hypothetical protein
MSDVRVFNNFVEDKDCDEMIQRLEYLCQEGLVTKRDDGRIGVINAVDEVFNKFIKKYYDKALIEINDNFVKYNGYIATKYVEGVGMATHLDSNPDEEMGLLMYLNDDYQGGELTYTAPDGTAHAIKAKKGDMIYCPSWYPHGVNKVISGTRYFFTISLFKQD